jgi:hypothetical protein
MRELEPPNEVYFARTDMEKASPPNDTALPKLTQAFEVPSNTNEWPLYFTPDPVVIGYLADDNPTSLRVLPTGVPTE